MTSYHGWTHRPKSEGGTDPIFPEEEWPGGAATTPTPWAWRSDGAVGTDVPTDGSWTAITLQGGEEPPGQTAITLITDGIHIEEEGIYLITLVVWFVNSGASGGYAQARLVWEQAGVPSGTSVISPAVSARDEDENLVLQMTRFVAYPGNLSGFSDIKVACRQTTPNVQQPNVMLSVVQLTPNHNGSPNFPTR